MFYDNFENNLNTIFRIRDRISGTHSINQERAEMWVNSQVNQRRRDAAKDLIDNTYYVTFNEVFEYTRNVIDKIYRDIGGNDVYIYVGDKMKSHYFMAIIGIYFIKLLGHDYPRIIYNLDSVEEVGNKSIIILDDMAYTGIQLSQIYDKLTKGNVTNIYVGLIGITQGAWEKFEKSGMRIYAEKMYPNLKDVIGKYRFLDVSYYFSPYTEGDTSISIYFDHKIADPLSTFTKTLMYGPILECNLDYSGEYHLIINGVVDSKIIESDKPYEEWNDEDYIIRDQSEANFYEEFNVYEDYLQQLIDDDRVCDKNQNIINFIPFINGCNDISNVTKWDELLLMDVNYRCPSSWYKNLNILL